MQITTEMQASVIIQSYSLKISFELKHAFFFGLLYWGIFKKRLSRICQSSFTSWRVLRDNIIQIY